MTIREFIFDLPLYKEIPFDDTFEKIGDANSSFTIDGYNPDKENETTYRLIQGLGNDCKDYTYSHCEYSKSELKNSGIKQIWFECLRYEDELGIFVSVDSKNKTIMKIGQIPSFGDMHIRKVDKYKKVLSKEKMREFTKAIGLAANGVGIGSFVYLRRIFEYLIDDTFNKIPSTEIEIQKFNNARMDIKISVLKDFLPTFLVNNRKIYSILSKGVHELSEEECLGYFNCLKSSIEIMLFEKLIQKEREKHINEVTRELDVIVKCLNSNDTK